MISQREPPAPKFDLRQTISTTISFGVLIAALFFYLFIVMDDAPSSPLRHDAMGDLLTLQFSLNRFHADCFRFPTAAEGLAALRKAPPKLASRWKGPYQTDLPAEDPWGNPYQYSSDGRTFQIASYGLDGKPDEGMSGDDLVVDQDRFH